MITGTLVNDSGQPIGNTELGIHVGTTSSPLKANPAKKRGSLTPIEGTGKINLSIVGVEGGGALKLIDGAVSNPSTKTNDRGEFQFELSAEFLNGEEVLIITSQKTDMSSMITRSFPLMNKAGEPRILDIGELGETTDLGNVKLLDKG